jgi:hypothetical protein
LKLGTIKIEIGPAHGEQLPAARAARHGEHADGIEHVATQPRSHFLDLGRSELSGVLSRNTKRATDKQPEFRGTCTIDGVGYRISAWVKEGSDGKFFSLAFSVRDALPSAQVKPTAAAPYKTKQFDDEVPF